MAEYTISTNLYNKALNELTAQWRRKYPNVSEACIEEHAEQVFSRLLQGAVVCHEYYAPQRVETGLRDYATRADFFGGEAAMRTIEEMDRIMAGIQSEISTLSETTHRAGLIKIFTMDSGISQATAEQIVDNHILIHQK